MPLTEPRQAQVWPIKPESSAAPGTGIQDHQSRLVERALESLANELNNTRQAVMLQRAALCRVLEIEEADLLAAEKAIIEERQKPRIDETTLTQTIQQAIAENNQVIREWMQEMLMALRQPPRPATPTDPLDPDYVPPAPLTEPPDTIQHLEEPEEERPNQNDLDVGEGTHERPHPMPDPTRKMKKK